MKRDYGFGYRTIEALAQGFQEFTDNDYP